MIKISAIICTHNRSDLLPKAIDSLLNQTFHTPMYEIIVVDNASTDDTKAVCDNYSSIPNFRYVYEPVPGLSVARNRGLFESKGKYVAYIDDDAIASPRWLELLVHVFEAVRPAPVSVGGKILPLWETEKPSWFPDEKKPYLTILDYGDDPQFIVYPRILYGTNMAFEKDALLNLDSFRTDVGRRKGNLLSCEESDIYQKFARKKLPVYYVPEATVQHLVPKDRLTKKWLYKRHYWQGRSEVLLIPDKLKKSVVIKNIRESLRNIRMDIITIVASKTPTSTCNSISSLYTSIGRMQQLLIHLFKGAKTPKKELLVIARTLPRFDRGSGHLRFFSVIESLGQDYHVTYVPDAFAVSADCDDTRYVESLESMGVEVHTDSEVLDDILKISFDIVIFEFYDTAAKYLPAVQRALPFAFTVIDSVDVHFAREAQMANVHNDKTMLEAAEETRLKELEAYNQADLTWAVTESDKRILLGERPRLAVDVIPNIHKVTPLQRQNIERNTLLFVGNFWHQPNEDAAIFFSTEIFPVIKREVPDAVFMIVGNAPTEAVKKLASESVKVVGWVPDMTPYLETCHVSVVPLRYGAGMKGKVGEAMAAGVPVVTTSVGVQGMDVVPGRELLVADTPLEFARAAVQLLKDDCRARELSAKATEYIRERFTPEIIGKAVIKSLQAEQVDKSDRAIVKFLRFIRIMIKGTLKEGIPQIGCPINAILDDKIIFLGYDVAPRGIKPGDSCKMIYYWQCLDTIKDYAVFVHFSDSSGAIGFQNDHALSGSLKKGMIVREAQTITIPMSTNGEFSIRLGLWSPKNNRKMEVSDPGNATVDRDGRLVVGNLKIA